MKEEVPAPSPEPESEDRATYVVKFRSEELNPMVSRSVAIRSMRKHTALLHEQLQVWVRDHGSQFELEVVQEPGVLPFTTVLGLPGASEQIAGAPDVVDVLEEVPLPVHEEQLVEAE